MTTLNNLMARLETLVEDKKLDGGEPSIKVNATEAKFLIDYVESLEDQLHGLEGR
jgi:hypothetical protein